MPDRVMSWAHKWHREDGRVGEYKIAAGGLNDGSNCGCELDPLHTWVGKSCVCVCVYVLCSSPLTYNIYIQL